MTELTTLAMGRIRGDYPPPRHNVLLLSCMDLRLINELASFMDRDNLTNRYDHLVAAGAALGVVQKQYPSWRKSFFQHLQIAVELHQPKDVYIVEHRNCGAYKKLLNADFQDSPAAQFQERELHRKQALKLSRRIKKWCAKQPPINGKPVELRVHSFLMDLRGDVEVLAPAE